MRFLSLSAVLVALSAGAAVAQPCPLTIENCGHDFTLESAPYRDVRIGQAGRRCSLHWSLLAGSVAPRCGLPMFCPDALPPTPRRSRSADLLRRKFPADAVEVKQAFSLADPVPGQMDAVTEGRANSPYFAV